MIRKVVFIAFIAIFAVLFNSCGEPDDPVISTEDEVITTLKYTLIPDEGGTSHVTFIFEDMDGDGGNVPVYSKRGYLEPNTNYTAVVELFNKTVSPPESVTRQVRLSGTSHQFFFQSTLEDISIRYGDRDDNGNPIGLSCQLKTGEVESGSLTITLRHEPDKSAEGVSSGDITNAGGETDIEVTFDFFVQ